MRVIHQLWARRRDGEYEHIQDFADRRVARRFFDEFLRGIAEHGRITELRIDPDGRIPTEQTEEERW